MVVDKIENLKRYESLHPLFSEVVRFFESNDFMQLELGKTELKGKDLVINVAQTDPKKKEQARLETHHDFIDIQMPISGLEMIGYTPAKECRPLDAKYNAEKDITFFEGESQTYISLHPGMFAVFFPEDGHAPGITSDGVKKIVVKIRV